MIFFITPSLFRYRQREKSNNNNRTPSNVAFISNPSDLVNDDTLHANPAYEADPDGYNTYEVTQNRASSGYAYVDTNVTHQNHADNEYAYAETPGNLRNPQQDLNDTDYSYAEAPGGNIGGRLGNLQNPNDGSNKYDYVGSPTNSQQSSPTAQSTDTYAYAEGPSVPCHIPIHSAGKEDPDAADNTYAYAETPGGMRNRVPPSKETDRTANTADSGWMENTLYASSVQNGDS